MFWLLDPFQLQIPKPLFRTALAVCFRACCPNQRLWRSDTCDAAPYIGRRPARVNVRNRSTRHICHTQSAPKCDPRKTTGVARSLRAEAARFQRLRKPFLSSTEFTGRFAPRTEVPIKEGAGSPLEAVDNAPLFYPTPNRILRCQVLVGRVANHRRRIKSLVLPLKAPLDSPLQDSPILAS